MVAGDTIESGAVASSTLRDAFPLFSLSAITLKLSRFQEANEEGAFQHALRAST